MKDEVNTLRGNLSSMEGRISKTLNTIEQLFTTIKSGSNALAIFTIIIIVLGGGGYIGFDLWKHRKKEKEHKSIDNHPI